MQEFKPETIYELPKSYKGPGSVIEIISPDADGTNSSVTSTPKTFTPITIKNMKLKNRMVVSPMCMYSSKDGLMNDFHLGHYSSFARGGASLVVFEASSVTADGRISFADAGIYNDDQIEPLKRIVDNIHQYNCYAGIQIAHAGRKASTIPSFLENARSAIPANDPSGKGWEVYAPSSIPFNQYTSVPHEMTLAEIRNVIISFRDAAERCGKAGFDFINIHGAHGYLISSFLSPTSNKRTDDYGGSFENRCRFLFEIIKEIRTVWPTEKALGVRLSCDEFVGEQGWTVDDTVRIAKLFEDLDVDMLDCSSGGNSNTQAIKVGPGYQVPYATAIKKNTKLFVGAVGLLNSGDIIEKILQDDCCDLVFGARGYLRNPHFPLEIAHQLKVKVDYNIVYRRGQFTDTPY